MQKDKPALKHGAYSYLAARVYKCGATCPAWEACPETNEGNNCPVLAKQFVTRVRGMERALSKNGKYKLNEAQKMLIKDSAILENYCTLIEIYTLRKGPFIVKKGDIQVVSALNRFYLTAKNTIRRNLLALGLTGIFDQDDGEEKGDPLQQFWAKKMAGKDPKTSIQQLKNRG